MSYDHLSDEQLRGVARFTLDCPIDQAPAERAVLEQLARDFVNFAPELIANLDKQGLGEHARAFAHIRDMIVAPPTEN